MTKRTAGTAENYWAATAEGHFEAMSSSYQPGERVGDDPAPKRTRMVLPPLTPTQRILDAIAACVQPRKAIGPAPVQVVVQKNARVVAE